MINLVLFLLISSLNEIGQLLGNRTGKTKATSLSMQYGRSDAPRGLATDVLSEVTSSEREISANISGRH